MNVSKFLVSRFRGFWFRGRTDDRGQKTKDEGWSMRNDIQPNPLSSVFCLLSVEDFSNFLLRSNQQYDKLIAVHPEKDCPAAIRADMFL